MSGLVITLLVTLMAIFGPLFAPYGENEVVGTPFSKEGFLGTDYLGQDVWSRVLYGGTIDPGDRRARHRCSAWCSASSSAWSRRTPAAGWTR